MTKIEWCDKTLNPVVGCTHGCEYCYARRQAKRQKHRCQKCYEFIPHPHLERLEQITPRQKPKKIFIDSMWDFCCKDNKDSWLYTIIEKMEECPQHTFLILSKRPGFYKLFDFPSNVWLGTTITSQQDIYKVELLVSGNPKNLKFGSFEPLHGYIRSSLRGLNWVIVGAETGKRPEKIIPKDKWVKGIINQCRKHGIPLFLKNNLNWHWKEQEFPKVEP